jgi:hypothetical protein
MVRRRQRVSLSELSRHMQFMKAGPCLSVSLFLKFLNIPHVAGMFVDTLATAIDFGTQRLLCAHQWHWGALSSLKAHLLKCLPCSKGLTDAKKQQKKVLSPQFGRR